MEIRRCNLREDAEFAAVHALQRAAYEVEAGLIGTRSIPGLRETREQLAASKEEFWICVDDTGACAGVVAVEPEAVAGEAGVRVSRLAVHPGSFRRGIGRLLVSHVLALAGDKPVKVTTGAANAPGRGLYERLGFSLVGGFTAPDGTPIVEYRWRLREPEARQP
ncbi:MAG TPA: GNAT family N-acetyltransferase [Phycisphaerales bacterium]|nr:GNAT family N-acetyltransferase [Phycisphaerales bacterium]